MKILHSADWHMDSPITGRTEAQAQRIRDALLAIPRKVMAAAKAERCDLVLLAGDLFDGPYTQESVDALYHALCEISVPVLIAPGNHDHLGTHSPWNARTWPSHVHIFSSAHIESIALAQLDCRVYGAAFTGPEAPGLLEGFRADGTERYQLGLFHGDPTQPNSPYCPITAQQVTDSNLDYLALGHIHKAGQLTAGKTLCAWPGCPQGRGFDECGDKGVWVVTLEESCTARFLPLNALKFYDLVCDYSALHRVLPAAGSDDLYRITLTGEAESVDTDALTASLPQFPNLILRDRTVVPVDLWATAGDDTLEGVYFRMLQEALEGQDPQTCDQIRLAAKLSRQLLQGQEVKLP